MTLPTVPVLQVQCLTYKTSVPTVTMTTVVLNTADRDTTSGLLSVAVLSLQYVVVEEEESRFIVHKTVNPK